MVLPRNRNFQLLHVELAKAAGGSTACFFLRKIGAIITRMAPPSSELEHQQSQLGVCTKLCTSSWASAFEQKKPCKIPDFRDLKWTARAGK